MLHGSCKLFLFKKYISKMVKSVAKFITRFFFFDTANLLWRIQDINVKYVLGKSS
jgi:hypothetical protein